MSSIEARIGQMEAPESLDPMTNFYDQPPFREILGDISAVSGVNVSLMRLYLGELVKWNYENYAYGPVNLKDPDLELARDLAEGMVVENSPQGFVGKFGVERKGGLRIVHLPNILMIERDLNPIIANNLGSNLEGWPLWAKYIRQHFKEYDVSGKHSRTKVPSTAQSYKNWMADKIPRDWNAQ